MDIVSDILDILHQNKLAFYLGPAVSAITAAEHVPTSPEDLAVFLGKHVALPRRARGNPWSAAQYIESNRHRNTLTALMNKAYETPVSPSSLHQAIAAHQPPIIVDSWYDGAMREALTQIPTLNWGEIQGINHAGVKEERWFAAYNSEGSEVSVKDAENWQTILYKPHGGVTPHSNYLISDSDYVEVLTEIDIQTPIPEIIQKRRSECGFLFLGCRFHDQMLRSFARQIIKRSGGPHFAVLDPAILTRNELNFLEEVKITPLNLPLESMADLLTA
ncbi:SIR2 family NAD-dependent protein deacylase [Zymomonas mobilis]|uniref:Uncharacterized protein n=1 Tax=Zymomonas mobilis subsp. pomaceae (strain ATCC 29192 / DSM 22645 / JCM 10191 / CCUG 17912 / NBRC 13757 / NCIMB 11200 / NRRL B-4491 / Barker I) TaxID=579138 RepID=F8EUQ7_ZYMMT|nr:SIR2 family protein [Zymomonas mobilis]AEI38203.1 conserved hypothetical protein [Zymomonas mobilis subsp. pomaceae ATCC 29192]MDX5947893.1 SIR2 family protein [Zymomonas mobilis subsp. pomaceae]GEB89942.1 transcriptional regulator [Zymomonas mobilis subsp. pomaceae]